MQKFKFILLESGKLGRKIKRTKNSIIKEENDNSMYNEDEKTDTFDFDNYTDDYDD